MATDTTIAEYLYSAITCKDSLEELSDTVLKCDSVKLRMLWEIFFETGIHEIQVLEERIYAFGSELKEKDLLGREMFLVLISILNHLKLQ